MKNVLEEWFSKFVVFTVIVFVVLEVFEYVIFSELFYFESVLAGYTIPSAIVFAVFLGIVFATAQYVLSPRQASYSPSYVSAKKVSSRKPAKKKAKKTAGKKKRAKKRVRK